MSATTASFAIQCEKVIAIAEKMEYRDLQWLISRLIGIAKRKSRFAALVARGTYSIGDRIYFIERGRQHEGEILEIRRTRAVITIKGREGRRWSVPLALLAPLPLCANCPDAKSPDAQ